MSLESARTLEQKSQKSDFESEVCDACKTAVLMQERVVSRLERLSEEARFDWLEAADPEIKGWMWNRFLGWKSSLDDALTVLASLDRQAKHRSQFDHHR